MLSTPLWETPKPSAWKRLFKGYLICLACFWVVVLFFAWWWDLLPQSVSFVAPILVIVGLAVWFRSWLKRGGRLRQVPRQFLIAYTVELGVLVIWSAVHR
jgi:hypothetical protein